MGGELAVPPERMRAATVRIPGTTSARSALCPGGSCKVSTGVSLATPRLLRKPVVGPAGDAFERQADAVADAITRGSGAPKPASGAGGASLAEIPDEDVRTIGAATVRRASRAHSTPDGESVSDAVRAVDRGGAPLPGRIASEFGAALGHRFDHVRVHADEPAAQAAERIGARAFTHGDRIGFARGEYRPDTSAGRWLLAHELTHVAQQQHAKAGGASAAGPVPASSVIQRQPPADAPAAPALLTEAEITAAIAYNQARFSDPWTIATIRELIGIDKYPAVSDRDLALGVAAWQDSHPPLVVDGKIGVGTTRTITDALAAAGSNALRQQVRADHTVTASADSPVVRNVPSPAVWGVFTLNASLNTTLRRGWIIQELRNTWNETVCGGVANPNAPTLHYWEAWWVTDAGAVRIPTSLTTPPTHAAPAVAHDVWQRGLAPGTRGDFTMSGRLFTTLTLPAGFAIHAVADAGDLPSTTAAPNADDLGLVQGRRFASSHWNGCPAVPNFHTA